MRVIKPRGSFAAAAMCRTIRAFRLAANLCAYPMTDHQHDPFQWLESLDDPAALAWVAEQNAATRSRLDSDPRFAGLKTSILANLRDTRQIPFFAEHAGWLYNFHQDEAHPRGIYRRTTLDSYRANAQDWQTVIDIDQLAADEDVDWYLDGVSHYTLQPTRVLLSLTPGGSDATVSREYDLNAGTFVAGGFAFPYGKNHIAWRDLDSVFVCPAWDDSQLTRAGYPREVWLLQRGQSWADAQPLLQLDEDAMMVAAWRFLDAANPLAAGTITAFDIIEADADFVFGLPLRPAGTTFQRRVWAAIAAIPNHQTRTYGEIARALHSAPRAVGQACGANPFPLVIPCHRVLASGGGLGGFARHGGGFLLDVKRWLLAHEQGR